MTTAEAPRWDWSVARIAWLDVETTGLWGQKSGKDPLLLEVAMVVTDGDLNELGRSVITFRWAPSMLTFFEVAQVAIDMHRRSGLWAEVFLGGRSENTVAESIPEAERLLIELLKSTCQGVETPIVWGGFSPSSLDRPILSKLMPRLYSMIHYRTLDMSAVKLAVKNWSSHDLDQKDEAAHRALDDTLVAIETAKRCQALLGSLTTAEQTA